MDWRAGEPLPPADLVVTYDQPLHLHGPYNPKSMGHLLRDNLQYLIDLPLRFGRDPVEFDWVCPLSLRHLLETAFSDWYVSMTRMQVRWSSSHLVYSEWQEETTTAMHYRGLYNNRPSTTWQAVLYDALSAAPRGALISIHTTIRTAIHTTLAVHMHACTHDHPGLAVRAAHIPGVVVWVQTCHEWGSETRMALLVSNCQEGTAREHGCLTLGMLLPSCLEVCKVNRSLILSSAPRYPGSHCLGDQPSEASPKLQCFLHVGGLLMSAPATTVQRRVSHRTAVAPQKCSWRPRLYYTPQPPATTFFSGCAAMTYISCMHRTSAQLSPSSLSSATQACTTC